MPSANRLAAETSPYLLQHAGNPVDWWPWTEAAFAEARRRDVPVLISIGYSACHWCHVMAHESFEDAAVAELLNANFVAVKVDREERPDVDAVYMEAVQLLTGGGGWPMTVLALPDERPFWGGTYLPRANFTHLLERVVSLWSTQRTAIEDDAARLAEAVRKGAAPPASAGEVSGPEAGGPDQPAIYATALSNAAEGLLARYDPQWGGFGHAPKFPQAASLELLAYYWWRSGDHRALDALSRTLDAMSSGGIYDHLAGGFARYSTDRQWLAPHFEKMLYDNALLVMAYTHAWQLTGSARYRQVVDETVGYLLTPPIRLPEGAWASAEDADSEGREGLFYTWSLSEIEEVGGQEAAQWYGASAAGNWEGTNILWRPGLGDIARPPEIEQARRQMFERRQARTRPGLDGKVLTEWNAMAVAALAYAGAAFAQPAWVAQATRTAEVLVERLRRPDGRWLRSWRPTAGVAPGVGGPGTGEGGAGRNVLAYAGDYAWLVEAFTRLGEATGLSSWTGAAVETATGLVDLFWDQKGGGGFFTYGNDAEDLIARMKDTQDGATPSTNATAALALARLAELTGELSFMETAGQVVDLMTAALSRVPIAFPGLARAASYISSARREAVIASSDEALVRPVWDRFLPDTVLAWGEPYSSPLWEGRDGPEAAGRAFVCEGYTCKLPVTDPAQLGVLLDQPAPGRRVAGPREGQTGAGQTGAGQAGADQAGAGRTGADRTGRGPGAGGAGGIGLS
ncbi:MAG TPA: thioredoxin domain-containing protein [Acidimicrobiales bacterium]|nr:thioredoxin domain-containing protein [Acidimicrobiales bacterium]